MVLAGCGGDDDGATTGNGKPQQPQAAKQEAAEKPAREPVGKKTGAPAEQMAGKPTSEEKIRQAIEDVLTSADPDLVCRVLVTERFVESVYGSRQGCVQAQAPGSAADSVAVKEIVESDGRARAKAVPSGGPSSGETLTVSLILERGGWKVDTLRSKVPAGP